MAHIATREPCFDEIAGPLERLARLAESDQSLPRYSHVQPSYSSGETTRNSSLGPGSDAEREVQETRDRTRSEVYYQFMDQRSDLAEEVLEAYRRGEYGRGAFNYADRAGELVKKDWMEQGIYDIKWESLALSSWKHEELLEIESESETDPETEPDILWMAPKPKKRRPKSAEQMRLIAERLETRKVEREASRPINQFRHQVNKERRRLENQNRGGNLSGIQDLGLMAYETVKNTWLKRGIWWKGRWADIPGRAWKHEAPGFLGAPRRSPSPELEYDGLSNWLADLKYASDTQHPAQVPATITRLQSDGVPILQHLPKARTSYTGPNLFESAVSNEPGIDVEPEQEGSYVVASAAPQITNDETGPNSTSNPVTNGTSLAPVQATEQDSKLDIAEGSSSGPSTFSRNQNMIPTTTVERTSPKRAGQESAEAPTESIEAPIESTKASVNSTDPPVRKSPRIAQQQKMQAETVPPSVPAPKPTAKAPLKTSVARRSRNPAAASKAAGKGAKPTGITKPAAKKTRGRPKK